nr:stress-associated endoplasmic reticulum protein 2 isoform X1 [Syngnathus scovelli]
MVAKQRIRMANEKHSKNITQRGNVAKTLSSHFQRGSINISVKPFEHLISTPKRGHCLAMGDHRRISIQWAPGYLPFLYSLCVDQPYFRSSRVSVWECDPETVP